MKPVRTFAPIAILVALALAGCPGDSREDRDGAASIVDIDGCPRAYEELLDLDFNPVACSAGCPQGSHCDDLTDQCAFECINHSDCGGEGWTCDCAGSCVFAPDGPPGGDASCPRSATLLAQIKAPPGACAEDLDCPSWSQCEADTGTCAARTCAFDDECPHGSYCNAATGRCDYECIPETPGLGCATDERCDCYGKCVGADEHDAPRALPIGFELSRRHLAPEEIAAPLAIQVTMRTADAGIALDPTKHPVLRLEADPGVTVNGSTGVVTISTWSFADSGEEYAATATVTVARSSTFQNGGTYVVTARAADTRDLVHRLVISPATPPSTSPVPDGVYDLSGTFEIVANGTTPLNTTMTGGRAFVRGGKVYMQQEGATFNPPTYAIYANLIAPYILYRHPLPLTADHEAVLNIGAYPTYVDAVAAPALSGGVYANGQLHGIYGKPEIVQGTFRYTLAPRPEPLITCESSVDCPTFRTCATEIGVCAPELGYDMKQKLGPDADIAWKYLTWSAPGSVSGLEALVCGDPGAVTQTVDKVSRPLVASTDLRCGDGKFMRAAEVLARRDAGLGDVDAADAAAECVNRLKNGAAWSDACVNPQRFQQALSSGWIVTDKFSARLYQRILAQWLEVHTFIAAQLRVDDGLAHTLEDGGVTPALDPSSISTVLDQGMALGYDVGEKLLQMPADRLRFADYRGLFPDSYWTFDDRHTTTSTARDIVSGRTFAVPAGFTRQGDRIAGTGALTTSTVLPEVAAVAWNGGLPTTTGKQPVWRFVNGTTTLELGIDNYAVGRARAYAKRNATTINGADLPFDVQSVFLLYRKSANRFEVYANGVRAGELAVSNLLSSTTTTVTHNVYGWTADGAVWAQVPEDREIGHSVTRWKAGNAMPLMPEDDQNQSTVVTLLEYAAEYLRFGEHVMELDAKRFHQDCTLADSPASQQQALSRFRATITHARAAEALAADVYFRTRTNDTCSLDTDCGTGNTCTFVNRWQTKVCMTAGTPIDDGPPPWEPRWQRARSELLSELEVAERQFAEAQQCRNPLGVEKFDLPLYFSDTSGVNTSFFAASDYLLERLAEPAVNDAAGRFDSARSAWLARRNSQIQAIEQDYERQRRLEDLEIGYAQTISELCGLHNVPALEVLDRFDPSAPPELRLTPEDCFEHLGHPRGEVGQRALAVESAKLEARHAHERGAEALERYEEKDRFCTDLENDNDTLRDALAEHQARVASVREDLGLLAGFESMIDVFTDPTAPLDAAADQFRQQAERELRESEDTYNALYLDRTLQQAEDACWFEAHELRRSIRESVRAVVSAVANAEMATMQLGDAIGQVRQLVATAKARLAREEKRLVPSVAFHYWLDEELDQYRRSFERAQRYVYLTMLAVEYEFQQSLGLRSEILTADRPAELENFLELLRAEVASRTINGRRPEESTIVMSLREDVFRLADGSPLPGERDWESYRRFGSRLMSPQYAMRDADGTYLGQGVPFTLATTGALEYRCAERLWRVNATLQIDAPGLDTPNVPVLLLKKNTFASQTCEGHGDDPYQVTSMRPSAQLLSGGGEDVAGEASAFTASLLSPWLNVPRGEFYRDDYRIGSSEEFAGRGLYGDYILLFPEEGLLELTDPTRDDFPLTSVEDVLIRFDLISVDDFQN